jgi:hypothetical protein
MKLQVGFSVLGLAVLVLAGGTAVENPVLTKTPKDPLAWLYNPDPGNEGALVPISHTKHGVPIIPVPEEATIIDDAFIVVLNEQDESMEDAKIRAGVKNLFSSEAQKKGMKGIDGENGDLTFEDFWAFEINIDLNTLHDCLGNKITEGRVSGTCFFFCLSIRRCPKLRQKNRSNMSNMHGSFKPTSGHRKGISPRQWSQPELGPRDAARD